MLETHYHWVLQQDWYMDRCTAHLVDSLDYRFKGGIGSVCGKRKRIDRIYGRSAIQSGKKCALREE